MKTLIIPVVTRNAAALGERNRDGHDGSPAWAAANRDRSAEQRRTLTHAENAERDAAGRLVGADTPTIVGNSNPQAAGDDGDGDFHVAGRRVNGHVDQRLLQNAEHGRRTSPIEADMFDAGFDAGTDVAAPRKF